MRKKPTPEDIGKFLQAYARTARRPGFDPNDRQYSRQLEELIKHIDPYELDLLMRGEDDEELSAQSSDSEPELLTP